MNRLQKQLARLNPGLVGSIPTRSRHRAVAEALVVAVLAIALAGLTPTSALHAQQQPAGAFQDTAQDTDQDTAQDAETEESPGRPSPAGAFGRSMLIPGWGQAVAGSPGRGAFYFTVESFSVWMILKTNKLIGSANDILTMRRIDARERLMGDPMIGDLSIAIDADLEVLSAVQLQEIRRQQREDWLAFGVFFLLLGGADAFVAAHLADFPEPLEIVIRPLPDMGAELAFRVAF